MKPDVRGLFSRRIGWIEGEKYQPKFYLGRQEVRAVLGNARLESLWAQIEHRAGQQKVPAYWTDAILRLAKMIAAGERVRLATGRIITEVVSPDVLGEVLSGPFVVVGVDEALAALEEEKAYHEAEINAIDDGLAEFVGQGMAMLAESGRAPRVGQTTHQAMNLYRERVEREFTEAGRISQTGKVLLGRVEFIKRFLPDVDLGDFGTSEVEDVIQVIAKRPVAHTKQKKGGKQISKKYAQKTISAFRRMVIWWSKSKAVLWKRPDDLEFQPVRVKLNADEVARQASPIRIEYYDLAELVILWRYANSYERVFMALALNCGFGRAEIAQLRREEVYLQVEHPHAKTLGLTSDGNDSWIRRGRNKTGAYGEWLLWPATVSAIEWWLKYRPQSERPELIVKSSGATLHQETKGNNASQYVANLWQNLLNRVKKGRSGFRDLSFNKLRKTGSTFITLLPSGGEAIASLYLGHGYNHTDDANLSAYVNAPWTRLHTALRDLRDYYHPIWDGIAEPFADDGLKKGGSNISLDKIEQIQTLHALGKKTGQIAREVQVSSETVRRWVKRK